jgi:hypothetical protein
MQIDKQVKDWIVDAGLFAGFLAAMWMDLTGVAVHQWWGLLMGAACGYHLLVHRQWVSTVTRRLLSTKNKRVRRLWLLDFGVLVGVVATGLTGLVISTWLALPLAGYALWRSVHVIASVATLALVVAKIGVHWRWIMTVAQKKVFGVAQALPKSGSQIGQARIGRREFLGLLGAAGGLALLAAAKPLLSTTMAQTVSSLDTTASDLPSSGSATAQGEDAASTTCQIRCGNRCSYPGRCHRYTDTNGNQRCDLGECLA